MAVKKERRSGIEMLKIFAILFIVIFHVTQSLTSKSMFTGAGFSDGYVQLTATTDISTFVIMIFRHFGAFGNMIFLVCSSYFLVDIKRDSKLKVGKLWANTIVISVLFLAAFLISGVDLKGKEIIKSFFPVTFGTNWFIQIYLLFCLAVPYLNIVLERLSQKQLLRLSFVLFVLYYGISFVVDSFDMNRLILFITIYFMVCYFKKYMKDFWGSKRICIIVLVAGIAAIVALQLLTDVLGLKLAFMRNKQLHWAVNNNPILLFTAAALFFLFNRMDFRSRFINTVSSLSLYIYLIHENILFRTYTRVYIWHYIYEKIGYGYIILEILAFALALFVASAVVSFIYKLTFEKLVSVIMDKLFYSKALRKAFYRIENKLLGIR